MQVGRYGVYFSILSECWWSSQQYPAVLWEYLPPQLSGKESWSSDKEDVILRHRNEGRALLYGTSYLPAGLGPKLNRAVKMQP